VLPQVLGSRYLRKAVMAGKPGIPVYSLYLKNDRL
jgi:hypothetical protein